MSVLVSRCVEWQLDNPDASKEETGEFLKSEWEAGKITLPEEDLAKTSSQKGKGNSQQPKGVKEQQQQHSKREKWIGKEKARKRKESF